MRCCSEGCLERCGNHSNCQIGNHYFKILSAPHLQPAGVEEKLQQGKNGDIQVKVVAWVTLGGVKELTTNQTSKEEGVHSKSDNLKKQRDDPNCEYLPLCVGGSEH